MNKLFLYVVFALAFIGLAGSDAVACSCVHLPDIPLEKLVTEAKKDARAVFSGKVLSVDGSSDPAHVIVRFEVVDLWKGSAVRNIEITTGSTDANCGFSFEERKPYLVYAYSNVVYSSATNLMTGICTRTTLLSDAEADIKLLGKPRKPAKR